MVQKLLEMSYFFQEIQLERKNKNLEVELVEM